MPSQTEPASQSVFERLHIALVINACGIYTDLGGSRLSPSVWAAMTEINQQFVRMTHLLESAGNLLAGPLGAESGLVTPGAAASITLMVSAAMTGTDGEAGQRLPDTIGLRNEIVLQRNHRYKYDRQIGLTGARLELAGNNAGTSAIQLASAITAHTAAIFVPAHLAGARGTLSLVEVVAVARRHGLPVIVDAAYMCWPLEAMPGYVAAGADLVCFSAKYFGGPNAGGFIVGRRAMMEAVVANNFTRYESGAYRTFGRTLKMDRQTVVGVVTAFEEWLAMDHTERWARYRRYVLMLAKMIEDLPGLRSTPMYFTMDERLVPEPVNSLVVDVGPGAGITAGGLGDALSVGDPAILCMVEEGRLIFCVDVLREEEVHQIGASLRTILAGRTPAVA